MAILAAVALLWWPMTATANSADAGPVISAPEAIVIDGWTGHVLFAKSADAPRDPASTVKIMTALVVLRHHVSMQHLVTVSPLAASYGGSTAGLWSGERINVWDLFHGMLLPSGNDAAVVLAQTVTPSIARFAGMMNREAKRLHMRHTHFDTANGFDTPGQGSTARDLATVAREAMRFAAFRTVVRTRVWQVRAPDGTILHTWFNLNQLLWRSSYVDGVKTGTTAGAGACLVSSARKDGKWVIAVNMVSSEAQRFSDGESLLDYGFRLASRVPLARSSATVPV